MIISASRRTDIPAFYAEWFINRIHEGYCVVPNPFNRNQISYVSLKPEDVDTIVFWTRNPRPLMPHLKELDERGLRYYFQYTVLDYPPIIESKSPPIDIAIETFRDLADQIGSERVIWRYDPIVFTDLTPAEFHEQKFTEIASRLQGYTHRCVISLVDIYSKAKSRLGNMAKAGAKIIPATQKSAVWFGPLMNHVAHIADANKMEVFSCAEEIELLSHGIQPGKCVDDAYIQQTFGIEVNNKKDPSQRKACGCVVSKDIGMYDTCLFGCQYCYATTNFDRSKKNHAKHDPNSPSLIGWYDAEPPANKKESPKSHTKGNQLTLL
jgi:hypothetical protein